jgi:hypothetical protein
MRTKQLFLIIILAAASAAGCKKKAPAGDPSAAAAEVPAGSAGDCKTCELGSSQRGCAPEYLTAARDGAGKPVPGTWGCASLSSPAAQQACGALLACIGKNHCSTNAAGTGPGDNPSVGCFCGTLSPTACPSGAGANGPCVAAYKAAAAASVGGPAAGAEDAAFAAFIAQHAFDATTPIGIADDVAQCAIAASCPVCLASR